jgi:hypothetical protein
LIFSDLFSDTNSISNITKNNKVQITENTAKKDFSLEKVTEAEEKADAEKKENNKEQLEIKSEVELEYEESAKKNETIIQKGDDPTQLPTYLQEELKEADTNTAEKVKELNSNASEETTITTEYDPTGTPEDGIENSEITITTEYDPTATPEDEKPLVRGLGSN